MEPGGLTYIATGKGPLGAWLRTIGRTEDGICGESEEGVIQNSAYLRQCMGIGNGKGKTIEQAYDDMEWYRVVARAVKGKRRVFPWLFLIFLRSGG